MMEGPYEDDPYGWDVEKVISEVLRATDAPWLQGSALPWSDEALAGIIKSFQENEVDGHTLLKEINRSVLKDEFKIAPLKQRAVIDRAVQYLQQRSEIYQSQQVPQDADNSDDDSMELDVAKIGGKSGPTTTAPAIPDRAQLPIHTGADDDMPSKRRKLGEEVHLTTADKPGDNLRLETVSLGENLLPEQGNQIDFGSRQVKRLKPTFVRPLDQSMVKSLDRSRAPSSLQVEKLFYPLEPGDTGRDEFVILADRSSTERLYVNKQVQYYLRQSLEPLNDTRTFYRISPYRESLAATAGAKHRSFTVFPPGTGAAFQQSEDIDPALIIQNSKKGADDFDQLLLRHPVQTSQNGFVTEVDEDDDCSLDEETWNEILEEIEDKATKKSRVLSDQEVNEAIAHTTSDFVRRWQENKRHKLAEQACNVWRQTATVYRGHHILHKRQYEVQIDKITAKIKRVEAEIAKNEWRKVSEIRFQCQSFEEFVYQREEARYFASIVGMSSPPPRPDRRPSRPRAKIPKRDIPSDEEVLDSDDDFIEYDEDVDHVPHALKDVRGDVDMHDVDNQAQDKLQVDSTGPDGDLDRLKPKTRYSHIGHDASTAIDLDSDPADPRLLNLSSSKTAKRRHSLGEIKDTSSAPHSRLVEKGLKIVRAWDMTELESRSDRRSIVIKLIQMLPAGDARELDLHLNGLQGIDELKEDILKGIELIEEDRQHVAESDDQEDNGLSAIWSVARWLGRLYVSFQCSRGYADETAIIDEHLKGLPDELEDLDEFKRILGQGLLTCWPTSSYVARDIPDDSAAEVDAASEASSEDVEEESGGKVRKKRTFKPNTQAIRRQVQDKERVREHERQKEAALSRLGDIPQPLNSGRPISYGEVPILLDQYIDARALPHQVAGIEFLWREIVANPKQQGCLLAHTMGLGKTMQVISFLSTLAQASRSSDPKIKQQVPRRLWNSRILILTPAGLVLNWMRELKTWIPPTADLGPVLELGIHSRAPLEHKQALIKKWALKGGLLVTSYETFTNLVNGVAKINHLEKGLQKSIKEALLTPDIVVADEAHKMKNPKCFVSRAAAQFTSKSRIALTGTPLNNNLEEYYAILEWIAPGYLGSMRDFKNRFSAPIKAGSYADSDHKQKRTGAMRLRLLQKTIEPLISRETVSVIADRLPPKVEFHVTLPLTQAQKTAYSMMVEAILSRPDVEKASLTKVFSWLGLFALLCAHPVALRNKMEGVGTSQGKQSSGRRKKAPPKDLADDLDRDPDANPNPDLDPDLKLSKEDVSSESMKKQLAYFQSLPDRNGLHYSVKAKLVEAIISHSFAAGDKVLLFAHFMPSLDYYENLCQQRGFPYHRIDGQSNSGARQHDTEDFNRSPSPSVFLVSVRAGGIGLNMQGANRVIMTEFGFNPQQEEQALARAYRIGQKKMVYVYRFRTGGTYEDTVHNIAMFKTQLSARVVDEMQWASHAKKKVKDYLFPPREPAQEDLSAAQGKDPKVLDKILALNHEIRNIELTEIFQREEKIDLTEEEIKAVDQMVDDDKLEREDPEAFKKIVAERERYRREEELLKRQQAASAFAQASVSASAQAAAAQAQDVTAPPRHTTSTNPEPYIPSLVPSPLPQVLPQSLPQPLHPYSQPPVQKKVLSSNTPETPANNEDRHQAVSPPEPETQQQQNEDRDHRPVSLYEQLQQHMISQQNDQHIRRLDSPTNDHSQSTALRPRSSGGYPYMPSHQFMFPSGQTQSDAYNGTMLGNQSLSNHYPQHPSYPGYLPASYDAHAGPPPPGSYLDPNYAQQRPMPGFRGLPQPSPTQSRFSFQMPPRPNSSGSVTGGASHIPRLPSRSRPGSSGANSSGSSSSNVPVNANAVGQGQASSSAASVRPSNPNPKPQRPAGPPRGGFDGIDERDDPMDSPPSSPNAQLIREHTETMYTNASILIPSDNDSDSPASLTTIPSLTRPRLDQTPEPKQVPSDVIELSSDSEDDQDIHDADDLEDVEAIFDDNKHSSTTQTEHGSRTESCSSTMSSPQPRRRYKEKTDCTAQ